MERQLDGAASRVVVRAMASLGIDQRVGVGAEAVTVEAGRLTGVRLADGEVLPAQLLVLATGTVAETALASGAGLTCERGVVVDGDPHQRRRPARLRLGDCAQDGEAETARLLALE